MIDGAGSFRTFVSVFLPNTVTAIVTVALFSFVWQYNDVIYSNMFLPSTQVLTLAYNSLGRFTEAVLSFLNLNPGDMTIDFYVPIVKSTGVLMMVAPIMIVFTIFQRFFVESIERSGITGQ